MCPRVTVAISDCENWREKILPDTFGIRSECGYSIMKAIISTVLAQEETVGCVTSSYIDDIYSNEDDVPATSIRVHQAQFGLECKDPERLEDGTQVLGGSRDGTR